MGVVDVLGATGHPKRERSEESVHMALRNALDCCVQDVFKEVVVIYVWKVTSTETLKIR